MFPILRSFSLAINDFMLVIQTKTMHENLNCFGNHLIAIDATHNTTCLGLS